VVIFSKSQIKLSFFEVSTGKRSQADSKHKHRASRIEQPPSHNIGTTNLQQLFVGIMDPPVTPPPPRAVTTKQFLVKSGAICFGAPHNIRWGSRQPPPQPLVEPPAIVPSGTVLTHLFEYNLAALNGVWSTYPLVHPAKNDHPQLGGDAAQTTTTTTTSTTVVAWFASHESLLLHDDDNVDGPYNEAKRILQVANSPYEEDNGVNRNTKETWDNRVLVVNRYDWGNEDSRGYQFDGEREDGDDDEDYMRKEIFLVDYGHASKHEATFVNSDVWVNTPSTTTTTSHDDDDPQQQQQQQEQEQELRLPLGVSMVIKQAEYIFGRFGLTDDRKHVHSFLYFTGKTELSQTVFALDSEQRPIYVKLTPEQRHAKRLADGSYHFIRSTISTLPAGLLGPFGVELLSREQIQSIQQQRCPRTPFEPSLCNDMSQLINECLCSWVVQLANAATAEDCTTRQSWLDRTLPRRAETQSVDSFIFKCIEREDEETVVSVSLNQDGLKELAIGNDHKLWNYMNNTNLRLDGAAHYLIGEVLELAGNVALDNQRSVLVPYDLRVAIGNDMELSEKLGQTRRFFPPDLSDE
jgi:hypothetical protein